MSRLCSILTLLLCFAINATAAEPTFTPDPGFLLAAPTNIHKRLRLESSLSIVKDADFTNGLGRVSVARIGLSADYSIFKLAYGLSDFTWTQSGKTNTFSSADSTPWSYLHDVTLQARLLNNRLSDKWRYWLNGELSSSFEKIFPGAVGAGFDGGVAYDFWDGWMLGVTGKTIALSALSGDLFGDVEFGVAVAVSQKALRKTLRELGIIGEGKEGSERVGLNLAFSGSEKTYRLASHSPVRTNGYLGIVRSKVGLYFDYSPDPHWIFSLGPEYHYARKYKIYDSSGKLHSSHDLENAMGGFFRLLYVF